MASYLNGVVTINMRAYYPFGRSDLTYISDDTQYHGDLIANSCMLEGVQWETRKDYAADSAITEWKQILLFNPGTEAAHTTIQIAGNLGSGVNIYNKTTDQMCKVVGL